jgi:hypothetical protein
MLTVPIPHRAPSSATFVTSQLRALEQLCRCYVKANCPRRVSRDGRAARAWRCREAISRAVSTGVRPVNSSCYATSAPRRATRRWRGAWL